MENQFIETPENYAAALKEIDVLMSAEPGTAEGRRLEILADLVQKYEAKHFSMYLRTEADEGLPIDEEIPGRPSATSNRAH
ncbi:MULTISPECIES: hypothetical protein [unclassified Janthinobacterium]|uniref:hypothetical protein n=1 Tax=unclassified Janthinobacterium TaxID=2610881 RepID=UPI0018CB21E6|nr:hypothetical protein [Janthinobacterium sp. CG_23.4]MDH6158096.1 antitoxin component HigA of HigAB toxin-antitoxin module [Janthinobacterium sp. CG_23.4]